MVNKHHFRLFENISLQKLPKIVSKITFRPQLLKYVQIIRARNEKKITFNINEGTQ